MNDRMILHGSSEVNLRLGSFHPCQTFTHFIVLTILEYSWMISLSIYFIWISEIEILFFLSIFQLGRGRAQIRYIQLPGTGVRGWRRLQMHHGWRQPLSAGTLRFERYVQLLTSPTMQQLFSLQPKLSSAQPSSNPSRSLSPHLCRCLRLRLRLRLRVHLLPQCQSPCLSQCLLYWRQWEEA